MPSEEIVSPPYAGDGTTTELLYMRLLELRDWVNHYREEMNEQAGQEAIPPVRKPPKLEVYRMQPVQMQHQHLLMLNGIREFWDGLVREFEDAWDSHACLRDRLFLLERGAFTFNNAFTPFEVSEARSQQQQKRLQKRYEKLKSYLETALGPEDEDEDEDEE